MAERQENSAQPELPARVTLPLLTLITEQSLDEDYRLLAQRRALEPDTADVRGDAPRGPRWGATAAVVVVFGILVSTAAVQTSQNADVDDASRATLIERIDTQRERQGAQQGRLADLRSGNTALESLLSRLTDDAQADQTRVRRLQVRTGFIAVEGEGIRVTVENAPDAEPNQVVRDSDLALLANALWSSGAEAISINGQRLTTQTAIRNSGTPVEVNSIGVAPPYTVLAIGDVRTLQANFFNTSSGLGFDNLAQSFGFTYTMDNEDQLTLPAAPERLLRLRSVGTGTGPGAEQSNQEEVR